MSVTLRLTLSTILSIIRRWGWVRVKIAVGVGRFPRRMGRIVSVTRAVLRNRVLKVCLCNSTAVGKLHPSDSVSVLVVAGRRLDGSVETSLAGRLLGVSNSMNYVRGEPLRMAVVGRSSVIPLRFPPGYRCVCNR